MFVSKSRSVVYPQSEHARLAGTIAQHWGNQQFARPDLPYDEFCAGVALHDFGYGVLDNHDILGMDAIERRSTFESLLHMNLDNPIVEIVAKMHVARLMNMAGLSDLEEQCRLVLKDLIAGTGIAQSLFVAADTITRLCDSVAFDFCFEQSTTGNVAVWAEHGASKPIELCYEIDFRSSDPFADMGSTMAHINLMPWPLSCHKVKGYLLAYDRSDYPAFLQPHVVKFEISPG